MPIQQVTNNLAANSSFNIDDCEKLIQTPTGELDVSWDGNNERFLHNNAGRVKTMDLHREWK